MIIERSNYEIWLIDMLDGKLNELQIAKLMSFLDSNPDLKEELNSLSSIRLDKASVNYPGKDLMKKSDAEIPDSQFQLLCVAYLEHDLNNEQKKELEEIISRDPERDKVFQLLHKTTLIPQDQNYKHKVSLKRNSLTGWTKPVFIRVLSAAAMIAMIFSAYLLLPESRAENKEIFSENISDTLIINNKQPVQKNTISLYGKSAGRETIASVSSSNKDITANSPVSVTDPFSDETEIEKVPVVEKIHIDYYLITAIDLELSTGPDQLIAFNPETDIPETDDDRSRIGKFLAKTYRDIILKDEKASDIPLKGYEIAEGGINGLNKLLGWEMALTTSTDSNGELKSVYFSSRLLKFNTPVKKNDQDR